MRQVIHALVVLLIGSSAIVGADASCKTESHQLYRLVPSFTMDRFSTVEAILELGRQEHICFGLRNLSKHAFVQNRSGSFENKTVQEILVALLAGERDAHITDTGIGTIYIYSPSSKPSVFDHRLARFSAGGGVSPLSDSSGRVTLLTASFMLSRQLEAALHPPKGTAGGLIANFSPGDSGDRVGPFSERDITVTHALNLLVGDSNGASWIAAVPDDAANHPPMWEVVEYSLSVRDYRTLVGQIAAHYVGRTTAEFPR